MAVALILLFILFILIFIDRMRLQKEVKRMTEERGVFPGRSDWRNKGREI